MGTISPNISQQRTEVGREQTDSNQRLIDLLTGQFGTSDDQYTKTVDQNADLLTKFQDLLTGQSKQTADYNAAKLAQDKAISDQQLEQSRQSEQFAEDQAKRKQALDDENAANAAADANERVHRIDDASHAINNSFAKYDDGYFDKYAQNYANAQQPGLDQKYDDVQHDTALDFAGKGTLEGSAAVRQFGRVAAQKASEAAQIAAQGRDAAEAARSRIDAQKQTQLQTAISAAMLTPNVPLAGLANPGAAAPSSATNANAAGAAKPSSAPSFKVTQGAAPTTQTPDPAPVGGAKVDPGLGTPAPPSAPASTAPPTDGGYDTYDVPGMGPIQVPRFSTSQADPSLPPAYTNPGPNSPAYKPPAPAYEPQKDASAAPSFAVQNQPYTPKPDPAQDQPTRPNVRVV